MNDRAYYSITCCVEKLKSEGSVPHLGLHYLYYPSSIPCRALLFYPCIQFQCQKSQGTTQLRAQPWEQGKEAIHHQDDLPATRTMACHLLHNTQLPTVKQPDLILEELEASMRAMLAESVDPILRRSDSGAE